MSNPEGGQVPEAVPSLESQSQEPLPPLFAFIETPELAAIRSRAVSIILEAGAENFTPAVQEVIAEYQKEAEATITSLVGEDYKRALIGIMVGGAQIYADAQWTEAEAEQIESAWAMADGEGCLGELNDLLINLGYPP